MRTPREATQGAPANACLEATTVSHDTTKRCPKCNTAKPLSEFFKNRSRRDGHSGWCKKCMRAPVRRWERANRDRSRAAQARSRAKTRTKRAADSRRYLADNPHIAAAHNAVKLAIGRGDMTRQPCEICGAYPADAHHDDYDRPLDVRWLCPSHHQIHHRDERSQ